MTSEDIHKEIRKRIVEILKEAKISVNKLEELTGISQRTLQNQINEEVKISIATLRAIMGLFSEINPYWLLYGDPYRKHLGKRYEMAEENLAGTEEKKGKYFRALADNREKDVVQDILSLTEIGELSEDEKIIISRNNFYAPVIPGGCYVFLEKVSNWKKFVEFGKTYYIELKDNRDLFAFIDAGTETGYFTLISLHKGTSPMQLPVSLIKNIWLARRKIEEL